MSSICTATKQSSICIKYTSKINDNIAILLQMFWQAPTGSIQAKINLIPS